MASTTGYMAICKRGNKYWTGRMVADCWRFCVPAEYMAGYGGPDYYGLVLLDVVEAFGRDPTLASHFDFDDQAKEMRLRSEYLYNGVRFNRTLAAIREAAALIPGKPFGNLDHLVGDFRLLCPSPDSHWLPRSIAGILGITTSGVYVNVYSRSKNGDALVMVRKKERSQSLPVSQPTEREDTRAPCFWGPILSIDRDPLFALRRNVYRETGSSKTTEAVGLAQPAGNITFCDIRTEDPESVDYGRPEPGIRHIFDLEVAESWRPKFKHGMDARDQIELMTLPDLRAAVLGREFAPTHGLVILDFLARRRLLGVSEAETSYIQQYLHRPPLL